MKAILKVKSNNCSKDCIFMKIYENAVRADCSHIVDNKDKEIAKLKDNSNKVAIEKLEQVISIMETTLYGKLNKKQKIMLEPIFIKNREMQEKINQLITELKGGIIND